MVVLVVSNLLVSPSPIWIREDPSCSSCDGNVNKALVQIGQVMYLNCCSHEERGN